MASLDEVRKCVAFIGFRMADGSYRVRGTGFFVNKKIIGQENLTVSWLVTAKHVLDRIRGLGLDEVFIRVNMSSGKAEWHSAGKIDDWIFSKDPSVDAAIQRVTLYEEFDHLGIGVEIAFNDAFKVEKGVSVGDDVLITGLFRHHHGTNRNIPIIRTGSLAAMDEEKVVTKTGEIDAYLIEARSIGGLSGSPVFLNLGTLRMEKGRLQHYTSPFLIWLGLIHGHFDTNTAETDDIIEDADNGEKINVGIAIAVPVIKVMEMINEDYVTRMEKRVKRK